MKFKLIALTLVLTAVSWTQTSSPAPQVNVDKAGVPAAADSRAACQHGDGKDGGCCVGMSKDGASCCAQHAKDGQGEMACCHHTGAKDGEAAMACCGGKDGKSCMKDDKAANAGTVASCCPNGDCCGKGKACCDSAKDTKTAAMACCSGGHCGMMGHADSTK
jgi:hypothetical protein